MQFCSTLACHHRVDDPKRGFSFKADGPLDMRMNPTEGVSAAQWVNEVAEGELADTLYQLMTSATPENCARNRPSTRADGFRNYIGPRQSHCSAVRRRTPGRHPATRSFRDCIFINHELNELKEGLEAALRVLKPGGRLAVISFHSEDRIVKRFMRENSRGPNCRAACRHLSTCRIRLSESAQGRQTERHRT